MSLLGDALDIRIHGIPAGRLQRDEHNTVFWLHESYLEQPSRPVLGQYFEERLGRRRFVGNHGSLPGFFANLVPERGSKMRRVLAQANGLDAGDEFGLLASLGADLHGAVTARDEARQH